MVSKGVVATIIGVAIIASLSGGLYMGHMFGTSDSQLQYEPLIAKLNATIANTTAENTALRRILNNTAIKTIKIGYIAPNTKPYTASYNISSPSYHTSYLDQIPIYTTAKPFIEHVLQPDMNEYAESLGSNVRFEFVLMDAKGQPQTHLEHIQELKQSGVDIFIGGGWSSQACSSMSYVNANNMLMLSPSSTSPSCAVADDRFYRMCPIDGYLYTALADIIWSYGIEELVILQIGDSYGDGFVNLFTPRYSRLGGFSQVIRYQVETKDFCPILERGREMAQGATVRVGDPSRVGVLLIAYDEASTIIQQAAQCDLLYDLTWFGGDYVAKSANITAKAPLEANHLRLFSPLIDEPDSQKYIEVKERCMNATEGAFSVYFAYLYDSAFVLAKTILETGSGNATRVSAALPEVCDTTIGATGWLRLNRFGDRAPPLITMWYYAPGAVTPSGYHVAGTYRTDTNQTTWNTRTSDYQVMGPRSSGTVKLAEPRIVSDKAEYLVGETVRYFLEFYNPNQTPLTFRIPWIIQFLEGYIGDSPWLATYIPASNASAVIIQPGETYSPGGWMGEFTVERTGYYKISYGNSVLLVWVAK